VATLEGQFLKLNPTWGRVLGFSDAELMGQPFLHLIHPLDRDDTIANLAALAEGSAVRDFENRYRCKDGQYRWLRWSCPAPQAGSNVIYTIARDVTDEKQLEEFKDQFLATVSHELRTPLTAITGGLELVVSGECGPVSASQMEFLSASADSAQRLTDIIDDLLDVESIASGKVTFELETITAGEIVREVARTFRVQAANNGLRLVVEVMSTAELTGDKQKLIQAISNLVSNAIKYTGRGEVRLTAGARGNDVEISVTDTGFGMSEEDQQYLFQRFFRASDERVQLSSGTGLGLVIVKEIIERHGGRVEFESEKGLGTEVRCILPTGAPVPQRTAPDGTGEREPVTA